MKKEERAVLLDEMGFNLRRDVRSSVPRLTLSLNSGHWIDEEIDIYKLISDELYPGEVCSEERREGIKALHMQLILMKDQLSILVKMCTLEWIK